VANLPKLKERWLALCAGFNLNDAESQWLRILHAYQEPNRAYHNLDHIEHCLDLLDEHDAFAENPDALAFAIWFHDIVYDTHATNNEEVSAQRAADFLADHPLQQTVSEMILATRHTGGFLPNDQGILCDIDLAILGAPPLDYDDYATKIRREYAWVDAEIYAQKRTQVLQQFVDSGVYTTVIFDDDRESQARTNLQREIERLQR